MSVKQISNRVYKYSCIRCLSVNENTCAIPLEEDGTGRNLSFIYDFSIKRIERKDFEETITQLVMIHGEKMGELISIWQFSNYIVSYIIEAAYT